MEESLLGCPEPLERIFRQVELESERRAEEEQLRAAQLALEKEDTLKKAKARRRGSISISRLGHFAPEEHTSVEGPPTPKQVSNTLASSSPFYKAQLTNASTSSIASGASAFSDDNAHTEDPTQVFQIEQIVPKSSISKIIPRRLSRARSTLFSPPDAIIDVSIQETTEHISVLNEDGQPQTHSRRSSVVARGGLRKQPSKLALSEASPSSDTNGNWIVRARGFTQKFRRKGKQDPQSPTTPCIVSAS